VLWCKAKQSEEISSTSKLHKFAAQFSSTCKQHQVAPEVAKIGCEMEQKTGEIVLQKHA
jgi:hypothetical protein